MKLFFDPSSIAIKSVHVGVPMSRIITNDYFPLVFGENLQRNSETRNFAFISLMAMPFSSILTWLMAYRRK